jgi:hypothetical protein
MTAETGQADGRRQLAHQQIDDQQASGSGRADARDPRLRAFAQAVPFEQTDHGQRQQQDHGILRVLIKPVPIAARIFSGGSARPAR